MRFEDCFLLCPPRSHLSKSNAFGDIYCTVGRQCSLPIHQSAADSALTGVDRFLVPVIAGDSHSSETLCQLWLNSVDFKRSHSLTVCSCLEFLYPSPPINGEIGFRSPLEECPGGGIGRRTRLKIWGSDRSVRVQVPPGVMDKAF